MSDTQELETLLMNYAELLASGEPLDALERVVADIEAHTKQRELDARIDELGAVDYFSGVGLVHYNGDGNTVRNLDLHIEDLEAERQKLEEKL